MKINLSQQILQLHIEEETDIDTVLASFAQSRKARYLLYQQHRLSHNRKSCHKNEVLSPCDVLTIALTPESYTPLDADFTELDIIYEDDLFLAVNKPPHLLVHSDGVNTTHTLCNRVQAYYIQNGWDFPVRPLHRLDMDTSGLVLFCKLPFFQPMLDAMMESKQIHRDYDAIVTGQLYQKKQTICLRLGRDRHDAKKTRVSSTGKEARTTILVQKTYARYTWVKAILSSGRTHQIRVHLAAIHHPVLNDPLYGEASSSIDQLALHASTLRFHHPIKEEDITLECPLPQDMRKLLR